MPILSGDPPGLSIKSEPVSFTISKVDDGTESGSLWPLCTVAVSNRSCGGILVHAAMTSSLFERDRVGNGLTAVLIRLPTAEDPGVEESLGVRPSTAMDLGSVQESSLLLETSACTISPGKRKSCSHLLIDAGVVRGVVLVREAHITVEHHLGGNIAGEVANSFPLVVGGVDDFRGPSFEYQGSVVVVVELALVGSIAPGSREA